MEDSRQSREHGVSLLLHRGKITTDVAKSAGPRRTAKGPRNLLLHFGPPQITLGLVVGKRNPQIVKQSEYLISTQEQGIQQILGLALPGATFARSGGRGGWWRLSSIASRQNLEIAGDPVVALDGGNSRQVTQTPLLARIMQIEQKVLHLGGPLLLLLLSDSCTIAHQMSATDAVSAPIGIIARQSVVHPSPDKARPDANLVHRLPPSRGMPGQMGQEIRAVHMQPMQHSIDADAGLISMLEPTGSDQRGNALDGGSQPLCCQFAPLDQGSFRNLASRDCRQGLAGASGGEQLSLVQIHRQRLNIGTILHGCGDRSGKAAEDSGVTNWTTDRFDLMLFCQETHFRHVHDLPTVCHTACYIAEVRTALATHLGTVTHHLIWLLHHRKGVSRVPRLTSRTLASWTTRTAGLARQPIRRGRLTARATVFGPSLFKLLDPRIRLGQLLFQREQFSYQCFEDAIFFSQGLQFFFVRHRCTLVAFLSFGKSVGDLSSYEKRRESIQEQQSPSERILFYAKAYPISGPCHH